MIRSDRYGMLMKLHGRKKHDTSTALVLILPWWSWPKNKTLLVLPMDVVRSDLGNTNPPAIKRCDYGKSLHYKHERGFV